jgi:hypothetical protein
MQPRISEKTRISASRRAVEPRRSTDTPRFGKITLTKTSLANLLDSVLYPNPDDPGDPNNPFGPYGPGGPVMQKWLWVLLNPQPLPPGPDPFQRFSWAMLNPQPLPPGPDPYRSAVLARAMIGRAVSQQQFAEVLENGQSDHSIGAIGAQISEFIDDYCGTRPPRRPGPRPRALDLLIAGAQFQKAADTMNDNPLQTVFSTAADQLFNAGLTRLENPSV